MARTRTAPSEAHASWRPPAESSWDRGTAKYERVATQLSQLIDLHEEGDQLPPESVLCDLFGVSHMTIRRTLEVLAKGGRVFSVRGRGTYVARGGITKAMSNQSFSETMLAQGRIPSSQLLRGELRVATRTEVDTLYLADGDMVVHVERLRLGDEIPMCVEYSTLPAARFPTILGHDLSGSLYDLIRAQFATPIYPASYRVRAHKLTAEESTLLYQQPGAAALRSHVVGVDGDSHPIEATTTSYRGDIYELYFELDAHKEAR